MELNKIKAVLTALKLKSFSKAAEELGYTNSALLHMADSIEDELGILLFRRSFAGVEWTEEGKKIKPILESLLDKERILRQKVSELKGAKEHYLRIGAYSSISYHIIPKILKNFKKLYPEIRVSVIVGNNLANWLQTDIADILFNDCKPNEQSEFVPILEDPYVAVFPSELCGNKKSIKREELYQYTLISVEEGKMDEYFDKSKFKEQLNFKSVDDFSVLSMVKEGLGIAILPSLVAKRRMQGVQVLKLEPKISRVLGFAYKKSKEKSYSTEKFLEFLGEQYLKDK